ASVHGVRPAPPDHSLERRVRGPSAAHDARRGGGDPGAHDQPRGVVGAIDTLSAGVPAVVLSDGLLPGLLFRLWPVLLGQGALDATDQQAAKRALVLGRIEADLDIHTLTSLSSGGRRRYSPSL